MANVTLHPPGSVPDMAPAQPAAQTPSQQVVQAANALMLVTDENNRQIAWRKLNALEDFDLCEIAGANASNDEWMVRATIAFGVRQIDGEPISRPVNKTQLRALVARLDTAGMNAILAHFQAQAADAAADAGSEADRGKN